MNKDWKELTIARYRCMSPDILISVGGNWNDIEHTYNSLAIIEEIKKETEIGKYFVEVEKHYLTSLKDGGLLKLVEEVSLLTR